MFEEFLQLLGDKVRLRGFDKYKGGLGTKKSLNFLRNLFEQKINKSLPYHVFSQILFMT
jgi:hypothetical protein